MPEPRTFDVKSLAAVLPPGGLTLLSGCSAESALLADAIEFAADALGAMTFCATMTPGFNRRTYLTHPDFRFLTYFMTPELRAMGDRVEFLPLCYQDVLGELRRRQAGAALFMCSPPDENGLCSFGVQHDFLAELWPEIPVRIAHINPSMPRIAGFPGIPFDQLTAWCEADHPLITGPEDKTDAVAESIAQHVAPFIGNGATLQVGVGKIPGAVLRRLTDRRNLRLHSGLVGDAALDLIAAGAMAPGYSATVGVAIGSQALYAALSHPPFAAGPVSITHGLDHLAVINNLVTINSALEMDLLGQGYSELADGGLMSGPGGASDFARGARASGGLRIIALPADARKGSVSRIIAPGRAKGPVSISRMDVDLIVTEHGVADLRAESYAARAEKLIGIAAPQFREELQQQWQDFAARL